MLEEAADGEVFAAGHGEGGNDFPVMLSTTRAERVDGGYRFYGHKIFGSLTPVWTRLGLHAMDTSDPAQPEDRARVHAARQRGLSHRADLGRPRHARHALGRHHPRRRLRPRPVHRRASCRPGCAGADLFVLAIFAWAEPTFANIYVGIAQRAIDLAVASSKKRTSIGLGGRAMAYHPMVQHAVAEMTLDAGRHDRRTSTGWPRTGRTASTTAACGRRSWCRPSTTASKAPSASSTWRWTSRGGTGMFKSNELERLYRDVRCGGFHPANSALVHEIVGKTTLGILGEEPRW